MNRYTTCDEITHSAKKLIGIIVDERESLVRDYDTRDVCRAWLHATELHVLSEWHEDEGDVIWWHMPVKESPYVGSPLDRDWPWGSLDDKCLRWQRIVCPEGPMMRGIA